MKINLERLSRRLNYDFKRQAYLKQALTHRSASSENYERYEFLGDSILSFVIATQLFNQFPLYSEGQMSRLRSLLVRDDTLADIGKEISLGDYLYLGQGELKTGGFRRASILADALEALFAAIYLDGGIDAAKEVILSLYQSRLEDPNLSEGLKDPKTQIQEYLQAEKQALPEYTLVKVEGDDNEKIFYVTCSLKHSQLVASGQGPTRRKAEQLAAQSLLNQLK